MFQLSTWPLSVAAPVGATTSVFAEPLSETSWPLARWTRSFWFLAALTVMYSARASEPPFAMLLRRHGVVSLLEVDHDRIDLGGRPGADSDDDDVAVYLHEIDGVGVLRARDFEHAVLERSGDRHHLASFERFVLKRAATAT